jgi:hypothetical protein
VVVLGTTEGTLDTVGLAEGKAAGLEKIIFLQFESPFRFEVEPERYPPL